MPNPVKQIVMALSVYPRGGSAQVVRYLSRRLARSFETRLYTGSLGAPGDLTHAGTFFAGMAHPSRWTTSGPTGSGKVEETLYLRTRPCTGHSRTSLEFQMSF
jgi:hypothetical protein